MPQTFRIDAPTQNAAFPPLLHHAAGPGPRLAVLAGDRPQPRSRMPGRRTKIWELPPNLHCSIIGTCLSTAELRRILTKAGAAAADASDHDLHKQGVRLAGQHNGSAKLLNKALDQRHRLAIKQSERASTEHELRSFWHAASERGDIPGGYWAVLTHPAAEDSLIVDVFGEVHMLSHLVGAANRADIRRLGRLEADKAALEVKVLKQQAQLRDAVVSRDAKIRDLGTLLARKLAREASEPMEPEAERSDIAMISRLIGDLERRLESESGRRRMLEGRLAAARSDLCRERELRIAAERRQAALREELEALEAGVARAASAEHVRGAAGAPQLAGMSVLYVGGRPAQALAMRALAQRSGADFLHHDGGVEDSASLLAGLVVRAEVVLFPVDCVSHAAVSTVKQLCRQMEKPYLPLRSSGLGSFLAAMGRLAPVPAREGLGASREAGPGSA